MNRNITLGYIITFLRFTWFWLGVWVFYYLKYTDYAGIGLIETSLIVAMTLSEIPTGAVADLLGKKNALLLAFLLQSVGIGMLAFVPSLPNMIIGVFIAGIGGSFFSGTFEALLYDSLKSVGKENRYDRVISHIGTISLAAPAVCGIIGGYMYLVWPPLPTAASAVGYALAFIVCLFLAEPAIDSEKFTLKNVLLQTKYGVNELFKTKNIVKQTMLLLSIGFIIVIADEMMNSFLGVEFGFNEKELAFLWSIIYLGSSVASQLTPFIRKKFGIHVALTIVGCIMGVAFMLSPVLNRYPGGLLLLIVASLQALFVNFASIAINESTVSKYRATALSVFNMLKNIPYVLSAYFIGALSDIYSAKTIAMWMGVCLLMLIALQGTLSLAKKKTL